MKYLISLIILDLIFLTGCSRPPEKDKNIEVGPDMTVRLWLKYDDIDQVYRGLDPDEEKALDSWKKAVKGKLAFKRIPPPPGFEDMVLSIEAKNKLYNWQEKIKE